jgi:aminopeptidase
MMHYITEYAELIIAVGVNIRTGQNLFIKTGPGTYSFARILAETAYRKGAGYVHIEIHDAKLFKARIENQSDLLLKMIPDFILQQHKEFLKDDWAYIRIDNTEDRKVLEDAPADKLNGMQTEIRKKLDWFYSSLMRHDHAWCVVCAPGDAWAQSILGPQATAEDLWKILLPILKLPGGNAVEAWKQFGALLEDRCSLLNSMHIKTLHLKDSGTDLRIGLHEKALWIGGGDALPDGRWFFPNLPTEEIFSVPDFRTVEGHITTTRPVTVLGKQVIGASISLRNGQVDDFSAESGQDVLEEFFSIDTGSRRLGEIALVDESSPIAQSGISFNSILYDENASCHIAFGAGYPTCLSNNQQLLTDEELLQYGCNVSVTHVDFMIGSSTMNITAELRDGTSRTLMRNGSFTL